MPALAHRHVHMTEEEFLRMPTTHEHVELIDGDVIVSPAPTTFHQELVTRLVLALRLWARAQRTEWTVLPGPHDIRFAPSRILQPDVAVWEGKLSLRRKGPRVEIPRVCVEVLSQDEDYDRHTKRLIYASAGVGELWAVAPEGRVEVWSGAGLATATSPEDRLTSAALPEFSLDLGELFAE